MAEDMLTLNSDLRYRVEHDVIDLRVRDGGLRSGHVPLDLINAKDVPVNRNNLDKIGLQLADESSLKGTDGQIQPVMLGLVEVHFLLDTIDGFHRFAKFKELGRSTIYATIIDVTIEELLDKRIQNTANHLGLQFARATTWVREAWSLNPYSERISEEQAFILGRLKGSNGSRLGLSSKERDEVMGWVDAKSALWGVDPMTIYSYLHTDETVASDLIHESRPDTRQATSSQSLTQSTLSIIGRQIPKRNDLQRVVARVIIEHKLSGTGISSLLSDVKNMDDEEAIRHINTVDFAAYKDRIAQKQVYRYPEDDILRLDRVRDSSRLRPLAEIATLTEIHIDLALGEGGFDPDKMKNVRDELTKITTRLQQTADHIGRALDGRSTTERAEQKTPTRTIEVFISSLTEFLRDTSSTIEILSEREVRTAERALARGRGTTESLERLKLAIQAYHKNASSK